MTAAHIFGEEIEMKKIFVFVLTAIALCMFSSSACAANYYTDEQTITISDIPSDGKLIIASYDESQRLVACHIYEPENGMIDNVTDNVTNSGGKIKAFLWNMTTLSPIEMNKVDTRPTRPEPSGNKTLVAYFSWTNKTEGIADHITEITGADEYEITPKEPYGEENNSYNDQSTRAYKEQHDDSARPEIMGTVEGMEQYDVVFLGYPIWYGKAPKVIYTFLESYDFAGKTVIPFCTSDSSGIGSTFELQALTRDASWRNGQRFAGGASRDSVEEWVQGLGLDFGNDLKTPKMEVRVGNAVFTATLEYNAAVEELVAMMKENPITINMNDYSGFEKVGPLGRSLTASDSQMTTNAGDIVLYNSNQIVMFYGSNSWSYTKIGHIDNLTGWEEALGSGDITAVFSLA